VLESQPVDSFALELGRGAEVGLALSLATMMFSVALGLRPASFNFLSAAPRAFFACCPGGNVSNILVLLARGNVPLSVSLTATSSLVAAFITPIAILFWTGLYLPTANLLHQIDFDALTFLLQTALVLAFPLLIGIAFNIYCPRLANAIRRPLVLISTVTLLVLIVSACVRYWNDIALIGLGLIGLVILHNALAFALGHGLARLGGVDIAERRALTYEVGIQNAGLAVVILVTQLDGLGGAAVVAGLWGTWHIIAGLMLVLVFRLADQFNHVSE